MFCNQCEQTAKGIGCNIAGVCGKNEEVADLQDLLVHALQGLALYAQEGRKLGIIDEATDLFTYEGIFSTLTNVDFDPDRFVALINKTVELREAMKAKVAAAGGKTDFSEAPATFIPPTSREEMVAQGKGLHLIETLDSDANVRSLKQTLLYGLKGIAAYADHAAILGQKDPAIAAFCYEALTILLAQGLTVEQCIPVAMKAGEINLRTMELLDAANTGTYGHPVPTPVPLGHRKGKSILITGHDLHDLELLLKQTEGKGIDIYTHGEMLPCHGYPELKNIPISTAITEPPGRISRKSFPIFPGRSCSPPTVSRSRGKIISTGSSPTGWWVGRA